jgi:nitroreductase
MSPILSGNLGLIFGRRSVRIYTPGEIAPETVTTLLEAAMAAPSAMTKDPWRFVVVRDPAALVQLAAILPGGKMLATASLAIVVAGDQDAAFERNISYLLQDCSAAIENLLLAAHGSGLGACWVGVHPSDDAIRRLKEMLSLPSSVAPVAVVALGLPGETLEPRTRYNPGFVHQGKWGGGNE